MRFTTLCLFLLAGAQLMAQPKLNSPYSIYGLGDPVNQYFAAQTGQGGLTAAFHDPFHLNFSNPASLGYLRSTALETALVAKRSDYRSASDQKTAWSGNLGYLALGFTLKSPINEVLDKSKSPWQVGMGFSLSPTHEVGYNIRVVDTTSAELGRIATAFEGTGGAYKLNWGTGVKYNHTAVGFNLGWVFGKSTFEKNTIITDTDTLPYMHNTELRKVATNGIVWSAGAQHDFVLKYTDKINKIPLKWVTLGLSGEGNHTIRAGVEELFIRSRGQNTNGSYSDADTLLYQPETFGDLVLPATITAGIQYTHLEKIKIGAQYGFEKWSAYKNPSTNETLRDVFSVSFGIEYIPDYISYNRYMKRVRYRAGAFFRQDPRIINGENLNNAGITLGLGFPILLPRQQTSFVNAAFELGQIGAGSAIEENYFRLTLGFTLNDNTWFYKRRFE